MASSAVLSVRKVLVWSLMSVLVLAARTCSTRPALPSAAKAAACLSAAAPSSSGRRELWKAETSSL